MLEQVWVDRTSVEPGDTVTVFVKIKSFSKNEVLIKKSLVIPSSAKGRQLSLFVRGGNDLTK